MDYFVDTSVFINQNPNLREPQIKGYKKIRDYFESEEYKKERKPPIAVLPTGSGKTGLIGILPYNIAEGRVLIVAPNLIIYDGITEKLDSSSEDNFWIKRGVILSYDDLPKILKYQSYHKKHLLDQCEIIVTNIQKTYEEHKNSLINTVPNDYFDMIIFDEAHHCPADTYKELTEYFSNAKVVKVTGTPFRADGKKIFGKIVYDYPLGMAMAKNYVKKLGNKNYIPEELTLSMEGEDRTYTIEEIYDLVKNEQDIVSRGVAYSEKCSRSVVEESMRLLKEKREISTVPHKIIAIACSIRHAEQIKDLYNEYDISATIVHSNLSDEEILRNKKMFENDIHQVIINVGMLGEGYDHKYISIVSIFRPFRTLSPYVQFVGRALRIIHESDKPEIDNTAHIVYHKALIIDELWEYYKEEKQKAETILEIEEILKKELEKETKPGNKQKVEIPEVVGQKDGYFETDSFLEDIDIIANYQTALNKYKEEVDKYIESLEKEGLEITDELEKLIERQVTGKKRKEKLSEKRPDLIWKEKDEQLNDLIYQETQDIIQSAGFDPQGDTLLKYVEPNYRWITKKVKTNAAFHAFKINVKLKDKIGTSRKNGEWSIKELDIATKMVHNIHDDLKKRLESIKKRGEN
ncbi:DEAD/DEAH box helicase [Natronospora cellulosivora (SeqCode)]